MANDNGFVLLTGTANLKLAQDVAKILGKNVGETVSTFADGEKRIIIPENLRKRDVFIIQPTCTPVDENIMELLLIIDAAKRSSASEITAVIPYFGYSRQDRKDRPRVPISASLVAGMIEYAGVDRIVTIDIHSEPEPGFVKIPWDTLYASYNLFPALKKKFKGDNLVIASPDKGGVTKATFYLHHLKAQGLAIVFKTRDVYRENQSSTLDMIGDVKGRDVLLVDDMIDTAGTICNAAQLLRDRGAKSINVAATHGIFSPPAMERIAESVDHVFITDSVPLKEEVLNNPKFTVVSIAPLLAEAIKYIYNGDSLSGKLIPKSHGYER